jgi:DNA-binding NarL/FixJ family response regulator
LENPFAFRQKFFILLLTLFYQQKDVPVSRKKNYGDEAEAKADRALQLLREEWTEIVSYRHSAKNGELDTLHTDFLIFLRSRLAMPLQVKSSIRALREHIEKYPHIIAIVVTRRDTPECVAKRIRACILRCYKKIHSGS